MYKKVRSLIPAFKIDMGGIPLKQALPTNNVQQVDPFLLLHHGTLKYRKDGKAIHQGVGAHPHRGFTPVTFIIEGEIHHRDSRGNNQIAKKGEVQWMHAGSGIVHSERPSQNLMDRNGSNEMIQLWVNSPANRKMLEPSYQYVPEHEIPLFHSENKNISTKVIVGNYGSLKGKIKAESELLMLWGNAQGKDSQTFSIPSGFSTMIYTIKGNLKIGGFGLVEKENLIIFEEGGEQIEVSTDGKSEFLVLSGKPLDEKVVQHGPFVMNSETEILEAMRDYQMGKMGILIED